VLEISENLLDSAMARLPRWMAGVSVAGVLAASVAGHARWALGFGVGSCVAILAYRWLHRAVAAALDTGHGRPPSGTMTKLVIRYPLLVGVVAFFYWTGWLSLSAVIAGLFVPLAGALLECLILVGSSFFHTGASSSTEIAS
jgi:ATP synthase I chain